MAKILLVEDDELIAETILDALQSDKHVVDWIKDGNEGLERLSHYQYDLAVLDWMLPGLVGPEICRANRANGNSLPILMLTGKSEEREKVHGLDSGADDYLTKPFSIGEFRARVRALLRRPSSLPTDVLRHGDLVLDTRSHSVTQADCEVKLLPREYALLSFLLRHKNEVFSASQLLERVWSSESESTEYAVRQCIMRLRKRLASGETIIQNIAGAGYSIRDLTS